LSILETVKIALADDKQGESIECRSGEECSFSFRVTIPDTEIPNSKRLGIQLKIEGYEEDELEWINREGTQQQRLFMEKAIEKGEDAGNRIGENIVIVKINPPANLLEEKAPPKNYDFYIRVYHADKYDEDPVKSSTISLTVQPPKGKRKKILGIF
jgi:hypothetical protein